VKPVACIYARKSLDEKEKTNYSIASQLRGLEKLAADDGFHVPPEFVIVDDGFLGGEFDRPGFTRVLDLARTGMVKRIYVYALDRWVRGLAMQMVVEEELTKLSVDIKFLTEPDDVTTAEGRMFRQMRGVFAEFEKYKFRERASRGRKEKALQKLVNGGRSPYGYRYKGKKQGKRGELVVIPEQAEVVLRIFLWADEGMGLLAICRRLTAEGVRTISGRPWRKPVIAKILRNTVYIGQGHYNRTTGAEPKEERRRKAAPAGRSKKTSQKLRPQSEWIPVPVPAIIDAALFSRVRARLERDRHINSGRPSVYPLRGLMKCGVCGFSCCVFPNHGKPRYRCNNFDRLTCQRNCKQASVAVKAVEHEVIEATMCAFEDPVRISRLITENWDLLAKGGKQASKDRSTIERSIGQLKRREFRTRQAMQDADLQEAWTGFRDDLKDILRQRRTLEARLQQLQPAQQPAFDLDVYCKRVEGLRDLEPEKQRAVLRDVIERIELKDGEVAIHFRLGGQPATNCINRVGDVGAGDQQDQANRRHQHLQRKPEIPQQVGLAPATVLEYDLWAGPHRAVRTGIRSRDLIRQNGHCGSGLLAADAWFEAAQDFEPRKAPAARAEQRVDLPGGRDLALHHDGHVDVRSDARDRAPELGRRDAHNGESAAVQVDRLSHKRGVGSEAPLPQAITQHDHRMGAAGLVFPWKKASAKDRPDPQRSEVVARDEHALNPFGLAGFVQRQSPWRIASQAFEDVIAGTVVGEVRVGEHGASAAASAETDDNQPVGFFDRQLPDQHLVHDAENRRVGANANRQGEHGYCRKARGLEQHSRAVAQVLP
jgi:site-specific DNA recombinase